MPPRIRISAAETTIESDAAFDADMAAQFAAHNAIELRDLFAPDVQAMFARLWHEVRFVPDDIAIEGSRLRETPARSGPLLCWLLNRPALRNWLERVTGVTPLAAVWGATAQFQAGGGQQLDWHNDVRDARRRLGVTVNLGTVPYDGGRFEMKRHGSEALLLQYEHAQWGTALVFRIDERLMHRVTPVTAGGPRTVFGGWFLSVRIAIATKPAR